MEKEKYYYVTTEKDFKAGESLLNRAIGKPKESIEHSNPDGNLKTIIVNKRINMDQNQFTTQTNRGVECVGVT